MPSIKITKATIIQSIGPDTVLIETALPATMWPFEGTATVKMEVAKGSGEAYVAKYLRIPAKVIKDSKG